MKIDEIITELTKRLDPKPRGRSENLTFLTNIPYIECQDGFRVSVQASAGHYCSPRNNVGPWYSLELGYPSAQVPSLKSYKEGSQEDQKSVFGWVPIDTVAALIKRHGGFATKE